jgi:hypothetical protein
VLAAALLLAQTPALAPAAPAPDRAAEDARAQAAFAVLSAGERKEFLEYLELEIRHASLFQDELVRFVLREDGRPPSAFPEPLAPTWFDPATHAPEAPTPRHALAADSAALLEARRELLAGNPARALASAWQYDYARRDVVRLAGWDDPARVLANALAGCEPGYDLAEALVEKALDDGAQQKVLEAFGHLYTDRLGHAFPGITLYDAWASGTEIEMPDVDTLALYHVLRDDWKTYRAPVTRQEPLYRELGGFFRDARSHRVLRHALALCYLDGRPALGIYEGLRENLHLAWEKAHSRPSELAPSLPASADRQAWIDALIAEGRANVEAWNAAELRRDTLASASAVVRATTLAGLQEFGAYKKLEGPPAEKH